MQKAIWVVSQWSHFGGKVLIDWPVHYYCYSYDEVLWRFGGITCVCVRVRVRVCVCVCVCDSRHMCLICVFDNRLALHSHIHSCMLLYKHCTWYFKIVRMLLVATTYGVKCYFRRHTNWGTDNYDFINKTFLYITNVCEGCHFCTHKHPSLFQTLLLIICRTLRVVPRNTFCCWRYERQEK